MLTPEEQRALDWQTSQRKRREFQRSLQAKLRAPSNTVAQLLKNWDALIRR